VASATTFTQKKREWLQPLKYGFEGVTRAVRAVLLVAHNTTRATPPNLLTTATLPRTPRVRLDRIRSRSKPIKPSIAVLAPKWLYRHQRQHGQFEDASTLRPMDVFAVAMRTCRHGTSPLRPLRIRDRKLLSLNVGIRCGIALAPIRPATASRLSPRSNCGKARKREITQPPALVARSSLTSLAIRARFYAESPPETVLFCTLLQILRSAPATRATPSR
jgi:hypothetical protein